jgi:hypothetical protein
VDPGPFAEVVLSVGIIGGGDRGVTMVGGASRGAVRIWVVSRHLTTVDAWW